MKPPVARILLVLLLIATLSLLPTLGHAQASAPQAQDAKVTFYSNGSLLSGNMPHANHAAFYGAIFDGPNRLVTIAHKRLVTFRLSPGVHIFSASYSGKHPAKNSQLRLNLAAGEEYFISAQAEFRGVIEIEVRKGRLDVVSCQTAHRDAGQDKPVEAKHIAPRARPEVVPLTSMPPCQ